VTVFTSRNSTLVSGAVGSKEPVTDSSRSVTVPEHQILVQDGVDRPVPKNKSSLKDLPRAEPWYRGVLGPHNSGDALADVNRDLQKALITLGYLKESDLPDREQDRGSYFAMTLNAVARFQTDVGLSPQKLGLADESTQSVLRGMAKQAGYASNYRPWRPLRG
jgi:hypothetical protein